MMHFASELFDTHPRFIQLKSMLMSLFNGEEIEQIHLTGLEHVLSVTLGPSPDSLTSTTPFSATATAADDTAALPRVHIRGYTLKLLASGVRTPRVELVPMGPALDLSLRRRQEADAEVWKLAMRRPKLRKQDVEKGLGKRKKNLEVDEMGDLRGRVHVARQDLGKLQTRKMKGLKKGRGEEGDGDSGDEEEQEEQEEQEQDGGGR